MKYLILIKHAESVRSETMPPGFLDSIGDFVNKGFESGILKDTAGLKLRSTAAGEHVARALTSRVGWQYVAFVGNLAEGAQQPTL